MLLDVIVSQIWNSCFFLNDSLGSFVNHRLHPESLHFLPGLVRSTCETLSSPIQHLAKLGETKKSIYQPYIYHTSTIYLPYINHISTIYQPHIYHTSTIYLPYINQIGLYISHINHIITIYLRTAIEQSHLAVGKSWEAGLRFGRDRPGVKPWWDLGKSSDEVWLNHHILARICNIYYIYIVCVYYIQHYTTTHIGIGVILIIWYQWYHYHHRNEYHVLKSDYK